MKVFLLQNRVNETTKILADAKTELTNCIEELGLKVEKTFERGAYVVCVSSARLDDDCHVALDVTITEKKVSKVAATARLRMSSSGTSTVAFDRFYRNVDATDFTDIMAILINNAKYAFENF